MAARHGPRDRLLETLMHTYYVAAMLTNTLRARGLPAIAAMHARRVAEELGRGAGGPGVAGLADFLRAMTLNSSRTRTRELAIATADRLSPHFGEEGAMEVYGMAHLTAALAAASVSDGPEALHHLAEPYLGAHPDKRTRPNLSHRRLIAWICRPVGRLGRLHRPQS